MDIDTITLPREEATAQLEQYREALRHHDDREYQAVARGLRWLRKPEVLGLLDLRAAITAGGVDDDLRPRLAVCQADAAWCWMQRSQTGHVTFANREQWQGRARRGIVRLPAGTLPVTPPRSEIGWDAWMRSKRAKAMVPLVPPQLRPRPHLRNYHVLWEAVWEPTPPVDPALLKHIGGDLYAVLGMWDLTDLERAVLAGRTR